MRVVLVDRKKLSVVMVGDDVEFVLDRCAHARASQVETFVGLLREFSAVNKRIFPYHRMIPCFPKPDEGKFVCSDIIKKHGSPESLLHVSNLCRMNK